MLSVSFVKSCAIFSPIAMCIFIIFLVCYPRSIPLDVCKYAFGNWTGLSASNPCARRASYLRITANQKEVCVLFSCFPWTLQKVIQFSPQSLCVFSIYFWFATPVQSLSTYVNTPSGIERGFLHQIRALGELRICFLHQIRALGKLRICPRLCIKAEGFEYTFFVYCKKV